MPHGKVCYVEIPTDDLDASVHFYRTLFGWETRTRDDGATAFDDSTGSVSGSWVPLTRLRPQPPGLLVYVMVDDIEAALAQARSLGSVITRPLGADAPELTARVLDPAGNVLGLYQEPVEEPDPSLDEPARPDRRTT